MNLRRPTRVNDPNENKKNIKRAEKVTVFKRKTKHLDDFKSGMLQWIKIYSVMN